MEKLVQGVHHFQANVFRSQRDLFEQLAIGQYPEALFITCSDSRVNPNLITHTEPGDLFVLRNAGNLVPPCGPYSGGEAATIEYAVTALKIRDVIVCGHSHCGAVNALLNPQNLTKLPTVAAWLKHAEPTWKIVSEKYGHLADDALLAAAIAENVLVQLEHLRSYPFVADALAAGKLKLHGWVYEIETGEIHVYDPTQGQFTSITAPPPRPRRNKTTMRMPADHTL